MPERPTVKIVEARLHKVKLQDLHGFGVRSLRRYIEEAEKSCKILENVHSFPISLEVRQKILEQRQSENAAYNDYLVARESLSLFVAFNHCVTRSRKCPYDSQLRYVCEYR